ncbi:hypothetical protein [Pseudaquabacterium rugosum]|jgi:hypothetical protein|uniref:Porin family protein n=1 Tax=Pseudaquabacterium rugosum TaxID=2984194 RepID=A0ABU9B6A4_9BURK
MTNRPLTLNLPTASAGRPRSRRVRRLALPLLLATLGAATVLPAAAAGNELALQISPAGLSSDDSRYRALAWDHDVGNGFAVGASLGYGNVHRGDDTDGVLALLRVRKRFDPVLPQAPWLRPHVGVEYGGLTTIWRNAELTGLYGGVHMEASDRLAFTVDAWAGHARDKDAKLPGGGKGTVSHWVRNLRLGIVAGF